MKYLFLITVCLFISVKVLIAQEEETEKRGFKKENLFTGGSISLSFFYNTFLVGGSPVFGYSLTKWADVGVVANYNYTSYRDYYVLDDRLRQTVYGGGFFTRIFPLRFLFGQAQIEHNWMKIKYIPAPNSGGVDQTTNLSGNSLLVGGGYTTGRDPLNKTMYGYFAVLWDVMKDKTSPYTDNLGRAIPIIRAGIHVPLFQGKGGQ